MAIGWLTILKTVPWTEVISNAPKVADGAKKLWKTVAKKTGAQTSSTQAAPTAGSAGAQSASPLETRVIEMETRTAELHAQMLASSELIKMDVVSELADRIIVLHNGQLVADGEPAAVIASPVVQQAYLGIVPEEAL